MRDTAPELAAPAGWWDRIRRADLAECTAIWGRYTVVLQLPHRLLLFERIHELLDPLPA